MLHSSERGTGYEEQANETINKHVVKCRSGPLCQWSQGLANKENNMTNCSNHRPGQFNFILTPGGRKPILPEELHFDNRDTCSWWSLTALESVMQHSSPDIICRTILLLEAHTRAASCSGVHAGLVTLHHLTDMSHQQQTYQRIPERLRLLLQPTTNP